MTAAERVALEDAMIDEAAKILERFKDSVPDGGHISLAMFSNGHIDAYICTGELNPATFVAYAWRSGETGEIYRGPI